MIRLSKLISIKAIFYIVSILVVSYLAWEKTLSFWFFKGYEAGWLMGVPHTFKGLYQAHAYLYYLDYLLFGWNPKGWYATAIVLHTITSLLILWYVRRLTKRIHIAGISALFFVAGITYHDVITWGSFNSYYAALLGSVIASLGLYHLWKTKKQREFLFLSLVFAFLAFFIRESGLTLMGLIILVELLLYCGRKKIDLKYFVINIAPFIAVAAIYLLIRHFLGAVSGDFADDSVQLRIKLLHDRLYLQLTWRVLLAYGRNYASLWIPYTWLNSSRELLLSFTNNSQMLQTYYFSVVGWLMTLIIGVITYIMRKTKFFSWLIFGFAWTVIWILFTAIAIPSSDTVLAYDYLWDTRRYDYYAYVGVTFWWAVILWQGYEWGLKIFVHYRSQIALIFSAIVSIVIIINIYWLRAIEKQLDIMIHAESRAFYSDFQKDFPHLSRQYAIYQYPYTDGLNDYLYEWFFVKDNLYPALRGTPFRTENQFARIIEKISKGIYNLKDTVFLDYNSISGLRNETQKAKATILNSETFEIHGGANAVLPEGKFPVEIPYIVHMGYSAIPNATSTTDETLLLFVADRMDFLTNARITVSATMSQRDGEPFLHLLPENLIDGNFGARSGWVADSIPAIAEIDLGKEKSLSALWWSSQDGPRVPSSYSVEVSTDGKSWQKVKTVNLNTQVARLDMFDRPITARFVRISIETTRTGAFAYLDELEAIGEGGRSFAQRYTDPRKMIADSLVYSSGAYGWANFTWTTNKTWPDTAPQGKLILLNLDGRPHEIQFKIPEMEIFSRKGEFLKKFITSIIVNPVGSFYVNIGYVTLQPQYEIKNTK